MHAPLAAESTFAVVAQRMVPMVGFQRKGQTGWIADLKALQADSQIRYLCIVASTWLSGWPGSIALASRRT
jgi:hypothetical protein